MDSEKIATATSEQLAAKWNPLCDSEPPEETFVMISDGKQNSVLPVSAKYIGEGCFLDDAGCLWDDKQVTYWMHIIQLRSRWARTGKEQKNDRAR